MGKWLRIFGPDTHDFDGRKKLKFKESGI